MGALIFQGKGRFFVGAVWLYVSITVVTHYCCRSIPPAGLCAGVSSHGAESSDNTTGVETPTHARGFPIQGHSTACLLLTDQISLMSGDIREMFEVV